MTNWENEIDKLELIRIGLGLNYNEIEKRTGINRGVLQRFFSKINEPKIGFFFKVKGFLESFEKPSIEFTQCDCKIVNGLLRRGKIKCSKQKSEHKF